MADEKRYKVLEFTTTGWAVVNDAVNLTRPECDVKLREFIEGGANPNQLKVVLNDDVRFPTRFTDND